jgi:hypothetical protein
VLTALLLTVLTLVGGAATASGAAPAPASRSLAPAAAITVTSAPAPPQTHHAGFVNGPDREGPDRDGRVVAGAGTGAVAQAGHEHPGAAADPAQAPRAGTGRPYLLLHAPPPPHDALTPAPPGPAEPHGGVRPIAAEAFDAPGSRRGALPGVRGPPGRTTGPTTGHPSCSADPASRLH